MMTAWIALATLAPSMMADPTVDDIVQKGMKDASFSMAVVRADQKELGKINKDFSNTYRIDTAKAFFKEPMKLRLEAKTGDTSVFYIMNGTMQIYRLPRANLTHKEDMAGSPGRVQTILEFGVLTPGLLGFFEARFVRVDRASGAYVFDLTFKRRKSDDNTRHRIWVNPQKRYTEKREWYNRKGEQLATFYYSDPQTDGGCTFPGRVEVRNVEDKVGGIMEYRGLKVNTGLSESMFGEK